MFDIMNANMCSILSTDSESSLTRSSDTESCSTCSSASETCSTCSSDSDSSVSSDSDSEFDRSSTTIKSSDTDSMANLDKIIKWEDLIAGLDIAPLDLSESDESHSEEDATPHPSQAVATSETSEVTSISCESDEVTCQIIRYKEEISGALKSEGGKMDKRKILVNIQNLYMLDVTALHLATTLIGRFINTLCSMEDIIADAAQRLLDKWQDISLEAFLKAKAEWEKEQERVAEKPENVDQDISHFHGLAHHSGSSNDDSATKSQKKRKRADERDKSITTCSLLTAQDDVDVEVEQKKQLVAKKKQTPRQPKQPRKKRKVAPEPDRDRDNSSESSASLVVEPKAEKSAAVDHAEPVASTSKTPRQPRQSVKKKKLAPLMARVMKQMKYGFRRS